jgi:TolB-like protein
MSDTQEPVTSLRTGVPMELERIVNKAMAKIPSERYQHIDEMLVDLRIVRNQLEPGSVIVEPTKRRVSKKKKVYLYSLMTFLIAIIIFLGVYYFPTKDFTIRSIAVLPFKNLSNDPSQEFFVDGITDVLISELGRIRALHVISQTSVMQYKSGLKSIPTIADELNVDGIVEGTVFSDGKRVRITTQLIHADRDKQLWSDKYEYDLTNIFSLQTEVAQAIAGAVEVQLTDHEESRLASVHNVDAKAYQLYLKGRYHWNQRVGENYQKCVEYFNKAIEIDSNFAEAYAGLADYYAVEPSYGRISANDAFPKAEAAALKALELDNNLAEAYASLGYVRKHYYLDWTDAEKMFKKALELKPNYATAHQWYASLLTALGNFSEAEKEIKLAQQYDPLSPIINLWIGRVFYYSREYDRAIRHFQKGQELHPDFYPLYSWMSRTYTQNKMHDEAIAMAEKARELSGGKGYISTRGYAYAMAGRRDEAMELLVELKKLSDQKLPPIPCHRAFFYIGLGQYDQAFRLLDIAHKEKDFNILFINYDPRFDPVRADPRFIELLEKIGLVK